MKPNTIVQADALSWLKTLPDESVHCGISSPPYFRLRSYLPSGDPNKPLEVGMEDTPEGFVVRLVAIFREFRRVLRVDGSLWVNLGDSYSQKGKWGGKSGNLNDGSDAGAYNREKRDYDAPEQCLLGIPYRFALAMVEDGWIWRHEVPWLKANSLPESCDSRFNKAHEQWFMFVKSTRPGYWTSPHFPSGRRSKPKDVVYRHKISGTIFSFKPDGYHLSTVAREWEEVRDHWKGHNYYFDMEAIRMPHAEVSKKRAMRGRGETAKYTDSDYLPDGVNSNTLSQARPALGYENMEQRIAAGETDLNPSGRNYRTTDPAWASLDAYIEHLTAVRDNGGMLLDEQGQPSALIFPTGGFRGSHFATFNINMIRTILKASCPKTVCAKCGAPHVRVVQTKGMVIQRSDRREQMGEQGRTQAAGTMVSAAEHTTIGFVPTCACYAGTTKGTVLDMFMGAGSTGMAAIQEGNHYVGCDLNGDYVNLALDRVQPRVAEKRVKAQKKVLPLDTLPLFKEAAGE